MHSWALERGDGTVTILDCPNVRFIYYFKMNGVILRLGPQYYVVSDLKDHLLENSLLIMLYFYFCKLVKNYYVAIGELNTTLDPLIHTIFL